MKKLFEILFIALINLTMSGQELHLKRAPLSDTAALALDMQTLATNYLQQSDKAAVNPDMSDRYMFEILAGRYRAAIRTMESLRGNGENPEGHKRLIQFELYAKAKNKQLTTGIDFETAYRNVFGTYLKNCNDELAYSTHIIFTTYDAVAQFTQRFEKNYQSIDDNSIDFKEAGTLLRSYFLYHIYSVTEPIVKQELDRDENKRYHIQEELIVSPTDGAELSVITVRKRDAAALPTILVFTIYADGSNTNHAILAASKGYASVVATSRGKRLSTNAIEPYKHEYKDVYAVIDWISQQPWCNGKVGMYGGSYNGFSQWASMKEKVHPALKTIVPSVSVAPGIDAPMENNVFLNFPYKWIPYVTNNPFLDDEANNAGQRWNQLEQTWFNSGAPYNQMDSIEGTPRTLFQEWISHPSYDAYWQGMIPYKEEFAHINIPVLSTTGYYDDGQRGAMYYYLEHLKYNPNAEHYLLIGPYDHWGAQTQSSANLRGYEIDKVAHLDIRRGLAYEWFDHILKKKEKPAILKDKVNFQVMGTNTWMHKPSLSAMSNASRSFYLGTTKSKGHYPLQTKESVEGNLELEVDLADRITVNNDDYYPWPIIKDSINLDDGLVFISEPFQKEMIINGSFSGELLIQSNKKDFDYSVVLYELTPEGRYFQLSFYIGRASYAKSREQRELLNPNELTSIRFDNTRITSKKISTGSKIVVVINGNKNPYGQINYGTGADVSAESIKDASIPLALEIKKGSRIILPVWTASN